jgi:hypothetical protein
MFPKAPKVAIMNIPFRRFIAALGLACPAAALAQFDLPQISPLPVEVIKQVQGVTPFSDPLPIPVAPSKTPAAPSKTPVAPTTIKSQIAQPAPATPAVPATPVAPAAPAAPAPAANGPVAPTGVLVAPPIEIDPRVTVRHDFGNGVGYSSGYTYLEGFIPLWQTPGESIAFQNLRIVNFDNNQFWEAQIGGGYRKLIADTVLGINGFYDGRNTSSIFYNQIGFGVEALREKWEFRGNFYFPLGTQSNQTANVFSNPAFVGTNISLDHNQQFQTAMRGLNLEAGRIVPSCVDCLRTYAYLGYYHYDASGVQSIDGIRGRLESWVNEGFSMNFSAQRDQVFGTTITGGLSFHLGGVPKGSRAGNELAAKLGNRVVRDPNIVIQSTSTTTKELAIDPVTGKPIEVRHVESTAAAGGNGSVEHPYQTLAQLQTGSATNQILFAHAGSVFNNQSITLKANQRFLGEGTDHYFTATQGTFLLPHATANTAAPLFTGIGAINLANNTEVAGMNINRTIGNAITGTNVNNILIDRNRIVGTIAGFSPVALSSTSAGARNWTVVGNTFNSGLALTETNGTVVAVVRDNTFLAGGNTTIIQTGGTSRYQIASNTFTGGGVLFSDTQFGGTSTTQFANNLRLAGGGNYFFTRIGGTMNLETTLPSNTPAPIVTGTHNNVPVGSAGFGNP